MPTPSHRRRRQVAVGLLLTLAALGCGTRPGDRPEAVLEVVERAAAARDKGDFEAFTACFTGDKAGRYREDLITVNGGDTARFFAGKRRMVVIGPVSIRRMAFATVRVFVEHLTGYKPTMQAAVVFRDGEWLIDSFVPGDLEERNTGRASSDGVIRLLQESLEAPRQKGAAGAFPRLQLLRALEVVAERRLPAAAAPLARLAAEDPDGGIRQFSVHILGVLGQPGSVPDLLAALADGDLRVRGEAALSLARLQAAEAIGRLQQLADEDDSPWARARAAEALTLLGATGAGASGD